MLTYARPEILGVKTYPTVDQIPEPVDLAIIATPAKTVPDVMEECGKAQVKGVIIVSAGFKETGPAGKALEEKILEAVKEIWHSSYRSKLHRHNPPQK